jgi:tRNA pseudouridine55 synthase
LRKKFKLKKLKVGHAGTLDPLATGLLILCTGKFTKQIQAMQGMAKEYTGTITVGTTTPSYDLETAPDARYPIDHITRQAAEKAATKFMGTIKQVPPVFSALKKDGKRLYEYARQGEEVKINAREVVIDVFEITRFDLPEIDFKVVCSKGTYIRSLAHDFGKELGAGAHLSSLRRTKIGNYDVIDAVTPEEFEKQQLS